MTITETPALFPSHWFREMPPEFAALLAGLGLRRSLQAGEYLYRVGAAAEGFYRLDRGRLRLGATHGLREFTIAYVDPGDWVGEVPLLDGLPHASDAQATDDSELLMVPKRRFEDLLEREPGLHRHFSRRLAFAMRLSVSYYGDLAALPLPARLAKRLLELAAQYGERGDGGLRIGLRLPQQLLADMMATSRQSISKELKAWEARGWIAMKYNTLILQQPEALRQLVLSGERGDGG
ncbi:Crp/Fnr family transcriptional regulator [Solimonas sp. K1W22B-7]|uniref:Crp/Fnr family transcriptional regulator n=1 Tax=Solimonas sp. K1W22B-7 TaxID=2303331 RepID=UPI0013C4B31B|nr:Crp/Fnr family transcriptional regulator [Solimonas sp. K1W22B-7]